jgi:cell division septation protein DedD
MLEFAGKSMSDQSFHEIQLSGKQLVFFFMCAVVLTVVVFLFGVSVGREVRGTGVGVQAASVTAPASPAPGDASTTAAATPPPATQPAPNELSYAEALGGGGDDPSKVAPPQPAAEEPPAAAPAKAAASVNPPATPPAVTAPAKTAPEKAPEKVTPAAPPPAPPKATPKATPAPVSTLAGWAVQVGAYNASNVASKEVTVLQGKGYPAFVFTESDTTPGPRYKVRVGPYSEKADADRILKNLTKEGYKPLLKR